MDRPDLDLGLSLAASSVSDAKRRKVFVKSYGCQMNVYDAQRMTDLLAQDISQPGLESGFVETSAIEDADLVILNTCHIRERATEKIFSELGKVRQLKSERRAAGKHTTVVVAGCVAQGEGGEILRRERAVDIVVGPQSYHRLPQLIAKARPAADGPATRLVETEFELAGKFAELPLPTRRQVAARGPAAYLTVQEGCDKFCTFCVVPYTRGAELSRPVAAIVAEAQALVVAGVREITLLGQNVNGYHGLDERGHAANLARLCRKLATIAGLDRIRYTTSHPNDLDDDLVAAHRDLPQLMPFLHLPVQSGSDRILKAMNRKHTAKTYFKLIEKLRAARPDIALSSDFIVGFPGETDDDFAATVELIRAVGFASSFSFKYSPRPGTPGADMPAQVAEPVKKERLARLQALLDEQRSAFNAGTVGRTLDVLLERPGRHPGQLTGRTPYLQQIQVQQAGEQQIGNQQVGAIVPVRITARGANSLFGTLTDDAQRETRMLAGCRA